MKLLIFLGVFFGAQILMTNSVMAQQVCSGDQVWNSPMNMCMPGVGTGICPGGFERTGAGHATPGKCVTLNRCPQGQFYMEGHVGMNMGGHCMSECPGTITGQGRVCTFDTPTTVGNLHCGVARDAELNLQCQTVVGCTQTVTREQEAVAAEAMGAFYAKDGNNNYLTKSNGNYIYTEHPNGNQYGPMEIGHNTWHREQANNPNPGQSFFLMHGVMIQVIQQRLIDAGLGCMPMLKQLPMPEYSFVTRNGEEIFQETNSGLDIVRSYVDSYEPLTDAASEASRQTSYINAYRQWIPFSPTRAQQYSEVAVQGSDGAWYAPRAPFSEENIINRLRSTGLENFGLQVSGTFHNSLHGAFNDNRDVLNSSLTATRTAFFWLIHGLVDIQPDVWSAAQAEGVAGLQWSSDWYTMVEAMPQPIETRVVSRPASTVERSVPATTKSVTKRVVQVPAPAVETCEGEGKNQVCKTVIVPPVFETVTETVVVQPAETELITIPAVFETITTLPDANDEDVKKGRGAFPESFEPIN